MIVLLGGGVGASRLARRLADELGPDELTLVVNTADDMWHYGLRVCPDVDTHLYALARLQHPERGWGIRGDTFRCMSQVRHLGGEAWFQLGDVDLATHLLRTEWLRAGVRLAEVTARLGKALGVAQRVVPMTESEVETYVLTEKGWLHYQEFLVKHRAELRVREVAYRGLEAARPTEGVVDLIRNADLVVLGPSNPVASILPIIALPGVRDALGFTPATVVAVTPVVTEVPIRSEGEERRARSRAALLAALGLPHDSPAIASLYRDFADVFVVDRADAARASEVEDMGLAVQVASTLVHQDPQASELVDLLLGWARQRPGAGSGMPRMGCASAESRKEGETRVGR